MKFDFRRTGERKIFGSFSATKGSSSLSYGFIKPIESEVNVVQKLLFISFNRLKLKTCTIIVNEFKILK